MIGYAAYLNPKVWRHDTLFFDSFLFPTKLCDLNIDFSVRESSENITLVFQDFHVSLFYLKEICLPTDRQLDNFFITNVKLHNLSGNILKTK